MNRVLNFSSSICRKLLWVCPEELRRDFGADMELVFADDIADSWLEAGIPGVIRVWRCAACERLRIRVVKHCIRVCAHSTILPFIAPVHDTPGKRSDSDA